MRDPSLVEADIPQITGSYYVLLTIEDIQLTPGQVRIRVENVHVLPSGEIVFEFEIEANGLHRYVF